MNSNFQEIQFHSKTLNSTWKMKLSDDSESLRHETSLDSGHLFYEDKRYWYSLQTEEEGTEASLIFDGVVMRPSPSIKNHGIIDTKSQAGLLELKVQISRGATSDIVTNIIEILPTKFDPASFKAMVDDICKCAIDLALRLSSSVSLPLQITDSLDLSSMQQKFFFLKYLIGNEEFSLALDKIQNSPNSRLKQISSLKPLTAARRMGRSANRELARGTSRVPIPPTHPLSRLGSFPKNGLITESIESFDTPENRFVKFVIDSFSNQLSAIQNLCSESSYPANLRISMEAEELSSSLRSRLDHSLFKSVGRSHIMPFGSPVLQKKSGYREILDAWLKFHIAASLRWDGGTEVFGAGKKDTDKLYEYWVFFELLRTLSSSIGIPMPSADRLVNEIEGGLILRLKAGKKFIHENTIAVGDLKFKVKFSYNRTFNGGASPEQEGSWSLTMRPDFTVSFWPAAMDEIVAGKLFQLVHLHFDAKYRIKDASSLFHNNCDGDTHNYQRSDIFVAHSYRDAIRRSGGAYIIYPGGHDQATTKEKYHEVLPGIGAFSLSPGTGSTENGSTKIGQLFKRVLDHLADEQSPRRAISTINYRLYNSNERNSPINGKLPDAGLHSVLVTRMSDFPPAHLIAKHQSIPLRVWTEDSHPEASLEGLKLCSRILHVNPETFSAQILQYNSHKIKFLSSEKMTTDWGAAPNGIYAILPVDISKSKTLTPKTQESLFEFIRFSTKNMNGIAPPELIKAYFYS